MKKGVGRQTVGSVPEAVVSGETAVIPTFVLFKWYEWVMFRDRLPAYPDDSMVLGRNLGPAINIGSAMTRKVLEQNGKLFVVRLFAR